MRGGAHLDVGAPRCGVQEGGGGADAAALVDRALGVGHALLDGAVVVPVARDAETDRALDEGVTQRVVPVDVGDGEGAVAAAVGVVAVADAPLQALEVGQHVGIAPAAVAELSPGIEVARLAAIIDVTVDGAGAAQRLAARGVDAPAGGIGAGLLRIAPVDAGIVEGLDEAGGEVDVGMPVARARFEHAQRRGRILAEAVGKYAARRARPDDHVVEGVHARLPQLACGARSQFRLAWE